MSYLLDKKIKRKKFYYFLIAFFVCLVLFYFRLGIWNGLAFVSHTVFKPVLVVGNSMGEKFKNLGAYFTSKSSLLSENENLKSQILESQADRANYSSVLAENISLKEILGRKDEKAKMILSAILSKPNQSPYDTLVIDVGANQGIGVGDTIFALGNIPIGRVSDVYPSSSKVILFSNSGEKIQVEFGKPARNASGIADAGGGISLDLIGRGGGNFEMVMPRDLTLVKGDQVVLPGIKPYVVGIVETIISDPRDPFIKAILTSPVNIQELKFVEVEK